MKREFSLDYYTRICVDLQTHREWRTTRPDVGCGRGECSECSVTTPLELTLTMRAEASSRTGFNKRSAKYQLPRAWSPRNKVVPVAASMLHWTGM